MRILAWPDDDPGGNPYPRLLADALRAEGLEVRGWRSSLQLVSGCAIMHLHWPDLRLKYRSRTKSAWRAWRLLALVRLARLRGVRIVWTVHNLHSHEHRHPDLEAAFWRRFTALVDGSLHLSAAGRELAMAAHPALRGKPARVVPHGHYRDAYPPAPARSAARAGLGLDGAARVVAFIGGIRPYKNVPALIRAARAIADERLVLLVAGRPDNDGIEREIREAAGDDPRVRCELRHQTPIELAERLAACDLVALPFSEILNSGSAILALSYSRPVLVPAKGALLELASRVGADWVRTFDGALTPTALAAGLEGLDALPPAGPDLATLAWDAIARDTASFYREVAGR